MPFVQLKPGTLLSPTPVVMVSCACAGERPNIINVAWVGTVNSDPPMLSISVRRERHSHRLIEQSRQFVVNLVSRELLKAADLCGVKSGADIDKFSTCNLEALPLPSLELAPAIAQSPAYLACQVEQALELGSHTMFIARIVDMGVRADLMDAQGKVDFVKADLAAYCHGEYLGLGPVEGFFGYSVARPEVLRRRMKGKKK